MQSEPASTPDPLEEEASPDDETAYDEEAPAHVDPDREALAHVRDLDPEAVADEADLPADDA